jgi:hypothetical protein
LKARFSGKIDLNVPLLTRLTTDALAPASIGVWPPSVIELRLGAGKAEDWWGTHEAEGLPLPTLDLRGMPQLDRLRAWAGEAKEFLVRNLSEAVVFNGRIPRIIPVPRRLVAHAAALDGVARELASESLFLLDCRQGGPGLDLCSSGARQIVVRDLESDIDPGITSETCDLRLPAELELFDTDFSFSPLSVENALAESRVRYIRLGGYTWNKHLSEKNPVLAGYTFAPIPSSDSLWGNVQR